MTAVTGGLAFAIATTKPTVDVQLRTNINIATGLAGNQVNGRLPDQEGIASWYALGLPAPDSLTCASTKFPRGTYLLVKNLRNTKTVICHVNDYGPEAWTGRAVDLSRGSFTVIDSLSAGTAPVDIWVVPPPPSSLNLPFMTSLGQFMGYGLCHSLYDRNYCEMHRQQNKKLR